MVINRNDIFDVIPRWVVDGTSLPPLGSPCSFVGDWVSPDETANFGGIPAHISMCTGKQRAASHDQLYVRVTMQLLWNKPVVVDILIERDLNQCPFVVSRRRASVARLTKGQRGELLEAMRLAAPHPFCGRDASLRQ